jgi:hypothetical protein
MPNSPPKKKHLMIILLFFKEKISFHFLGGIHSDDDFRVNHYRSAQEHRAISCEKLPIAGFLSAHLCQRRHAEIALS